MLKGKEYMTQQQRVLVAEFEAEIESEYALCIAQIQEANQAIEWTTTGLTEQQQNLANAEIDALRHYWQARLEALINLVSWRDPKLLQSLILTKEKAMQTDKINKLTKGANLSAELLEQFQQIAEKLLTIGVRIEGPRVREELTYWRLNWDGALAGLYLSLSWSVQSLNFDKDLTGNWENFDLADFLHNNQVDVSVW